jgi:hypothetical protein
MQYHNSIDALDKFEFLSFMKRVDEIQVLKFDGDLIMYYDRHPNELQAKLDDEKTRSSGYNGALPNKEITCANVFIFDTCTDRYSTTSIYKNLKTNKYWFKKAGHKYYFNIDITKYI